MKILKLSILEFLCLSVVYLVFSMCHNKGQIYKPECGEIHEKFETNLEMHPCVWTAWIEYDCEKDQWWGWVTGEGGLNVEWSSWDAGIVYNHLQIASDEIHGYDRFDEQLEKELEAGPFSTQNF